MGLQSLKQKRKLQIINHWHGMGNTQSEGTAAGSDTHRLHIGTVREDAVKPQLPLWFCKEAASDAGCWGCHSRTRQSVKKENAAKYIWRSNAFIK